MWHFLFNVLWPYGCPQHLRETLRSLSRSGLRLSTGSSVPAAPCFAHSGLSVSLLSEPGLLPTCSHLRAFALADPASLNLLLAGSCHRAGLGSGVATPGGPLWHRRLPSRERGPPLSPPHSSHPSLTITSRFIFHISVPLSRTFFNDLFGLFTAWAWGI